MEYGQSKIKVVWICHFSTDHIQEKLDTRKKVDAFAPWIRDMIGRFKGKADVDLYIISPIEYLKNDVARFSEGNIYYTFFNAHIPLWGRHWPGLFKWDYISDFKHNRSLIIKEVKRINPDIINVIGAENAYYSSSILDLKDKYPHLVTIQGFIHLSPGKGKQYKKKCIIEKRILSTCDNFAYQINHTADVIHRLNMKASLYHFLYPITLPHTDIINKGERIYDFIFFARIIKNKGVEDLIKALSNVKTAKPDVKLAIIGKTSENYTSFLKQLATNNNVEDNIEWVGFLPTQKEVHKYVAKSKITVLPTYNDIISGTIIESMFIKTPVIAYGVGGIPDLNSDGEVIRIVDRGDVGMLADSMLGMLSDTSYQRQLAEKAYKKAVELFDNNKVFNNIMTIYRDIINKKRHVN